MSAVTETLNYTDLESELHDAVNMSAIACELLERADSNGFKNVDWQILVFAVYHSNSLLIDLKRCFDKIHDSNVAAKGGQL
ncbi:hypothetical protein WHT83_06345 [Aminobacter sp. P9b]|uniref:hypothetical protein n=1 Tax=Aminobacter sp. P9b TaxID=3133697 RepID=UPI00324AD532